jgi:hypothetical protein
VKIMPGGITGWRDAGFALAAGAQPAAATEAAAAA